MEILRTCSKVYSAEPDALCLPKCSVQVVWSENTLKRKQCQLRSSYFNIVLIPLYRRSRAYCFGLYVHDNNGPVFEPLVIELWILDVNTL